MAEGDGNASGSGSGSGWSWNTWISAAKNKSTEVLEFVKKDLEELGTVVKNEASTLMSTTSEAFEKTFKLNDSESAASSMKKSFSSFLGQMNTVLNPIPDDSDTEAVIITENNETAPLTKLQQALHELQKNPGTFLKDPDQHLAAQYECWLEIISDQLTEERLSKHLLSSETLNQQYLTLCPDQVAHETFWKRYLFKKALIEDTLAHQEAVERREEREKQLANETINWEEEELTNDIELTEEEQNKLLEQYDNELKERRMKKVQPPPEPTTKGKRGKKKQSTETPSENVKPDENKPEAEAAIKAQEDSPKSTANSAETKSSSSSLDGEWECVTDDKI